MVHLEVFTDVTLDADEDEDEDEEHLPVPDNNLLLPGWVAELRGKYHPFYCHHHQHCCHRHYHHHCRHHHHHHITRFHIYANTFLLSILYIRLQIKNNLDSLIRLSFKACSSCNRRFF